MSKLYIFRGDNGFPYGVKDFGYVNFDGCFEYLSKQESALCKYKQNLLRKLENEFGEGFGRTFMATQAATLDYSTDDWNFAGEENEYENNMKQLLRLLDQSRNQQLISSKTYIGLWKS